MPDDLLDQRQAATRLGLGSARTLESWRHRGYGPRFLRLSPRLVRYRTTDLDKWLAACVVGTLHQDGDQREPFARRARRRVARANR